jgi:hypothetical protein
VDRDDGYDASKKDFRCAPKGEMADARRRPFDPNRSVSGHIKLCNVRAEQRNSSRLPSGSGFREDWI